jgi:hypothetical protein
MQFLKGRVHSGTRSVPRYPLLNTGFRLSRLAIRKKQKRRPVVGSLSFCTGAARAVPGQGTISGQQQAHLSATVCCRPPMPLASRSTR